MPGDLRITHDDIRKQLSSVEDRLYDNTYPREALKPSTEVLAALAGLETELNEAGRRHLRAELVRFIDHSFE